jgi:hypothetical protein
MACRLETRGPSGRVVRPAYLIVTLTLIALYPLLPAPGREIDFVVVSISAIPALVLGLRAIEPPQRRPWQLLVAGMSVVVGGNVLSLFSDSALTTSTLLEAAGDVFILAAALTLILRHGAGILGGVIDATIVALALGALLWEGVLEHHLVPPYDLPPQKLNMFIVVFTLAGVLGALAWLARITTRRPQALWLLIAALLLALAGNIVQGLSPHRWLQTVATMMFMGTYVALGLFGLEPSATQLANPREVRQEDELSAGRLIFLWVAVATATCRRRRPGIGRRRGRRTTAHGQRDAAVTCLVMVRVAVVHSGNGSERALRYEDTRPTDRSTERREFIDQVEKNWPTLPMRHLLLRS